MAKRMNKTEFMEKLQEEVEEAVHAKAKKEMLAQGRFYTLDVNSTITVDQEMRNEFEAQFK